MNTKNIGQRFALVRLCERWQSCKKFALNKKLRWLDWKYLFQLGDDFAKKVFDSLFLKLKIWKETIKLFFLLTMKKLLKFVTFFLFKRYKIKKIYSWMDIFSNNTKPAEIKKLTNLLGMSLTFGLLALSCKKIAEIKEEVKKQGLKVKTSVGDFGNIKKRKATIVIPSFNDIVEKTKARHKHSSNLGEFAENQSGWVVNIVKNTKEVFDKDWDPNNFESIEEALEIYQWLLEDYWMVQEDLESLRSFQANLFVLRDKFAKIRKIFEEIDALEGKKSAKERMWDLASNNLEAAKKNNWSILNESLLYSIGFKWLWGALKGYNFSSLFEQQFRDLIITEKEAIDYRARANVIVKRLSKTLKSEIAELEEDFEKLKEETVNFLETYRYSWGFEAILEIFDTWEKTHAMFIKANQDFEELAQSGILKRREVYHYLDQWAWNLSAAQEISFRFKKKLDRSMEFSVVKTGDLLAEDDNRLKEGWAQQWRMSYGTDIEQEEKGLCMFLEARDANWSHHGFNFLNDCGAGEYMTEDIKTPGSSKAKKKGKNGKSQTAVPSTGGSPRSSSSQRGDLATFSGGSSGATTVDTPKAAAQVANPQDTSASQQQSPSSPQAQTTQDPSVNDPGPVLGTRISAGALSIRGTNDVIPFGFSSSIQPTWVVKPLAHMERSESWNAEARAFFSGDIQFAKQSYATAMISLISLFGPKETEEMTPLKTLLSMESKIIGVEWILEEIENRKDLVEKWFEDHKITKNDFNSYMAQQKLESSLYLQEAVEDMSYSTQEFMFLKSILELSSKTKRVYESLDKLSFREKSSRDKVILTLIGLVEAKENNWQKGKEIALYIFGFKWLWGIFSGFGPSTDLSKEEAAFKKALKEYQELREALAPDFEKKHQEFLTTFDKTLILIEEAKKVLGEVKLTQILDAFGREFQDQFKSYFLLWEKHQNLYELFTKELLQGRTSYFLLDDHTIKNESDLFDLLPPLMISKTWKSKKSPLLNTETTQWSTHDVVKKSEAYHSLSKQLQRAKSEFDTFFKEKQNLLIEFYLQDFDRVYLKYRRAKLRNFFAKNGEADEYEVKEMLKNEPSLSHFIKDAKKSLEDFWKRREKQTSESESSPTEEDSPEVEKTTSPTQN